MNKSQKEKKPMKKHTKIFLRVLTIFFVIIFLFVGITTIITVITLNQNIEKAKSFENAGTAQLDLENTESGCWNIKTDNGLKVMQLTDVHLGGGWMSYKKDAMALNAVAALITEEKPDLVIVTGDIAYAVPIQAGTFNNKSASKMFANLMESLGVYWTLSYGNHDTEAYCYYSRESLTEFYSGSEFPHCLMQSGPKDVDGEGNQILNVVNSDGVVTRSLVVVDSHSYTDGDYFGIMWKYDNIHENQIEWYKASIDKINAQNAKAISSLSADKQKLYNAAEGSVKSSVFFHIPLEEYRTAWTEYSENGFKDTENVKYVYGDAGESGKVVYSGMNSDEFFEAFEEKGSTDSVFCGHDHLNNFSLNYKGINLTYGLSIDYLAYSGISKLGSQRGCTMLSIDPSGNLEYHAENYYQEKYSSTYTKEDVTMQEFANIVPEE